MIYLTNFIDCRIIRSKNHLNVFEYNRRGYIRFSFEKKCPEIKYLICSVDQTKIKHLELKV